MLQPYGDGEKLDAPISAGGIEIVAAPSSYKTELMRTSSYRKFKRGSQVITELAEISGKWEKDEHMALAEAKSDLHDAVVEADADTFTSLPFRIQTFLALTDLHLSYHKIAGAKDNSRLIDSYKAMLVEPAYYEIMKISRKLIDEIALPHTLDETNDLFGFGQELTMHGVYLRRRNPLIFSTQANAENDYEGDHADRIDAHVFHLEGTSPICRSAQVKSGGSAHESAYSNVVIYGNRDLRNTYGNTVWQDTRYASSPLPTLEALSDESDKAPGTFSPDMTQKLDTISDWVDRKMTATPHRTLRIPTALFNNLHNSLTPSAKSTS